MLEEWKQPSNTTNSIQLGPGESTNTDMVSVQNLQDNSQECARNVNNHHRLWTAIY